MRAVDGQVIAPYLAEFNPFGLVWGVFDCAPVPATTFSAAHSRTTIQSRSEYPCSLFWITSSRPQRIPRSRCKRWAMLLRIRLMQSVIVPAPPKA